MSGPLCGAAEGIGWLRYRAECMVTLLYSAAPPLTMVSETDDGGKLGGGTPLSEYWDAPVCHDAWGWGLLLFIPLQLI